MNRHISLGIILAVMGLSAIFAAQPALTLARAVVPAARPIAARALTDAERLACHFAIEEVFWRYRLWPPENKTPKPELASILSPETVQVRVADTARYSNLLATHWNAPVTGAMLQAEMDRMAAETRAPEQLRAIFAALNNDPALIAECLARPALAERLARDWYAYDERVHGALETQAVADLARVTSPAGLREAGGDYLETTWELGDPDSAEPTGAMVLDEAYWTRERERIASYFNTTPETIPTDKISPLQEDEHGFFALAVLEQTNSELRVANVRWQKQPFEEWAASLSVSASLSTGNYQLSTVNSLPATPYSLPVGDSGWLPTAAVPRRTNVTAVWTGADVLYFGGGDLSSGRSNEGFRYTPATDSWVTISPVDPPQERFWHTAVWTGSEMIIWGGCGPAAYSFCELSSGGRYNPVTGLWSDTSLAGAPAARLRHTAVWTGEVMIVWGGCNPSSSGSSCADKNTGGRYDPATDTWLETNVANAPEPRSAHSAVWSGVEMIVWGGEDGVDIFDTGGRYNPATDTWTATSPTGAPTARQEHTAVWTGSEMIIWGGCPTLSGCVVSGTPLDTGARYNPATDSWTPTNLANAPTARTIHTAIWTGAEMIVWGGITPVNILFNTGGRYNPATDSWVATSTTNAPAARFGHVAVWTGTEMIIWGGTYRSGGRYNPTSDSWLPTNSSDPNSLRANHVAVWTGTEMIVWGGHDSPNGIVDTGRIYTLATRTWRPTPESNLFGREHLAAVWTGTEMLVWGGAAGHITRNTGGRFNPATNAWTMMTTTNAPTGRSRHIAVWSGSEMIIWGGSSRENTGGRYDPAADTWTPTSLTNAPEGRYLHTGIWDGDELIVWGGSGDSGELDSGGQYDPVTDSWTPTSLTNAPDARHFHTAVWSGEKMIVWGGVDFDAGINFNSGGRYDPDSDSWQATSTLNAPEGRVSHSAVWTGVEMIVWGGCTGPYCLSRNTLITGGHYNPATDSWTPTALGDGVARARGEHSTVWTGNSMIVWGGMIDIGNYTNTGSEYIPDGMPPLPTPSATATGGAATSTPTVTSVPPSATATPLAGTPTATSLPPTATATPVTGTPTATSLPPTSTPTGIPPSVTPSATPGDPDATWTSVPATATATQAVATATPGNSPTDFRLFLPLVEE